MCRANDHAEGGGRRCRCCDPRARRVARREERMRERGFEDEVDEDFAAATVADRAEQAPEHEQATYDPSPTVRAARARAGDLTEYEEEVLAGDEKPTVRAALAGNRHASEERLDTLAYDDDRRVRLNVARNRNTPGDALLHLSRTLDRRKDLGIAQALARHRSTPREAFEEWVKSGTGGQRTLAKGALRVRAEAAADKAAGAVLGGTERLGTEMDAATTAAADGMEEMLGVKPQHEARVG